MQVFMLPDLGEGLTEAELVVWLVKVGDSIRVDQPIAELETAKSVVEVPSPYAGVVSELHGSAGQVLEVGKPLISIAAGAADSAGSGAGGGPSAVESGDVEASPVESAAAESAAVEPAAAGSGNVLIGYGTSGHGGPGRTRPAKRGPGQPAAAPAAAPQTTAARAAPATAGSEALAATPEGVGASAPPRQAPLVVSPLVRRLAASHGIALSSIAGSGGQGLILRRDVESAIAALAGGPGGANAAPGAVLAPSEAMAGAQTGPAATIPAAAAALSGGAGVASTATGAGLPAAATGAPAPAATGAAAATAAAVVDARTGLGVRSSAPLTGLRRSAAANLSRSRREIPEATVWVDVDATALVELRQRLKAQNGEAPSLMAFISRFAVAGLARFPALNTRLDTVDGVDTLVAFDGVNLGFAAQTDRGLVVPVVRGADKLSARGLDGAIRTLADTARSGKAGPRELGGGTFTVNNYGVFGVDGSAAIINHPEVAMLGIGRFLERPWVLDGALAVRTVVELTLAFDHRVCDGATAAGFLRFVADAVEDPGRVLADL
ncbi:dihydrolipoamide acetyltransferase family protein [Arthrobacter sp. 35W]|uniref:dihydrolipoamide acetyltransferase family protein n=1 Tax=Arthrobacter sp. 35W TaxID=1132441 RepID=UPI0004152696